MTYGLPEVVMSVAVAPVARVLSPPLYMSDEQTEYSLPDHLSCVPALKSLPPRPKTRRLKSASIAMHGEARTAGMMEDAAASKREARVRACMVCVG